MRPGRRRGGAHRSRRAGPVHVRARADRARALRRALRRPAGARPPKRSRRRSRRSAATIPPSGSASSPTTGLTQPSPGRGQGDRLRATGGRSGPRPARARRGAALVPGCARSARPAPPPTTRAVGPSCSSGSATRNDRPVIPRTARRCSRPAASPTTSTPSTSSCSAALRNNRGWNSIVGRRRPRTRRDAVTRALDAARRHGQPRPRPPAGVAVRRAHLGHRLRRTTLDGDRGRRHRTAHRRRRRARRRDSTLPRVDHDAADTRAPPALEHRGVRPRRRSRRPDRTPSRQRLPVVGGAGGGRPRDDEDRVRRSSSRNPSGSDSRSTDGRSRTTAAWQRMLEGDLDAAEQSRDRSPDARHRGRVFRTTRSRSTAPSSSSCAGCRAGCTRWSRSSSRSRTTNPALQIFRGDSRVREELRRRRRRGASAPRHRGRRRLPDVRRLHLAGRPRVLGRAPPRAVGHRPAATALYATPVAVARPVRDHAHHRPRGRGSLPRAARPHASTVTTKPSSGSARRSRSTKRWKRRSSSR